MAKLIINDNIEMNITNFNQNLSKMDDNINMNLNVQIVLEATQADLTTQLKNCLGDDTVDTIKIINGNTILYYTEAYSSINNVSFGSDFNIIDQNNDNVTGYINFEAH